MRKLILAALLASSAAPALASVPPPTISIKSDGPVVEGSPACATITKSAAARSYSRVSLVTRGGSALPGRDFTSVGPITLTFANAALTQHICTATAANNIVDGTRNFTWAITAVRFAIIGTGEAQQAITDDDVAPVPVPVPTPTPAPTGWIPSPSLSGLPDIASDFDIYTGIEPSTVPPVNSGDVLGAFRFICGAGQVLKDDPIVYPGQPGASHGHQFYGNNSADANSTYASLRQSGTSSCQGFTANPVNRSAYWMPELLDGKGNVVRPDYVAIYYKRRPASDPVVSNPANPQYEGQAVPLPNGLRYIFGRNVLKPDETPTGSTWFNCDGPTAVPGHYTYLDEALAHCPAGNRVGAVIEAPSCYDGKNLDSPTHREHVAYASYGTWGYLKCPPGFPYVIPTFTLGAWYSVEAGDDPALWHFSSDEMFPGQHPGWSFHADWFGAWDNIVLAMWTENCINKMLNCTGGALGNGYALKAAAQPTYMVNGVPTTLWKNPERLVPMPAM